MQRRLTRVFTWYFCLSGAYEYHKRGCRLSPIGSLINERECNETVIIHLITLNGRHLHILPVNFYLSGVRIEYLNRLGVSWARISARSGSKAPTACTSVRFALASSESDSRAISGTVFLRCYCDRFTESWEQRYHSSQRFARAEEFNFKGSVTRNAKNRY